MATFKGIHRRNIFFSTLAIILPLDRKQLCLLMISSWVSDDYFPILEIFDGYHTQEGSAFYTLQTSWLRAEPSLHNFTQENNSSGSWKRTCYTVAGPKRQCTENLGVCSGLVSSRLHTGIAHGPSLSASWAGQAGMPMPLVRYYTYCVHFLLDTGCIYFLWVLWSSEL